MLAVCPAGICHGGAESARDTRSSTTLSADINLARTGKTGKVSHGLDLISSELSRYIFAGSMWNTHIYHLFYNYMTIVNIYFAAFCLSWSNAESSAAADSYIAWTPVLMLRGQPKNESWQWSSSESACLEWAFGQLLDVGRCPDMQNLQAGIQSRIRIFASFVSQVLVGLEQTKREQLVKLGGGDWKPESLTRGGRSI